MRTLQWQHNQPTDQGKTFETEAGTTTSSTGDDILDFSERNPLGRGR